MNSFELVRLWCPEKRKEEKKCYGRMGKSERERERKRKREREKEEERERERGTERERWNRRRCRNLIFALFYI
jgi:hypothetical protein